MAVVVLTESTCDRCGRVDRRTGAHGDVPPPSWALVTVTFRDPSPLYAGWENSALHRRVLCHDCGIDVKDVSYDKSRASTPVPAERIE